MTLVHYQPWSLVDRFQQQLNQLAAAEQSAASGKASDDAGIVTRQWQPSVDITEATDHFVILVDLPGVEPKDIDITTENGSLSIKGERKTTGSDVHSRYQRVERASGTFYRRFSLPDTADLDKVEATGKNGVLEIILHKHKALKSRKIVVNS